MGCGLGQNIFVSKKYIFQNAKLHFFFFFKVNNQENARFDSFLNGTLDMS